MCARCLICLSAARRGLRWPFLLREERAAKKRQVNRFGSPAPLHKVPAICSRDGTAALEIPRIRFVDERTQAAFAEIVSTVDEMQLGRITAIRAADYIDLAFVLEDRVKVLLGNSVDLDYKLKFVRTILQEQVGEGQLAVINARESGHVSLRTTGVTQEEIYLE